MKQAHRRILGWVTEQRSSPEGRFRQTSVMPHDVLGEELSRTYESWRGEVDRRVRARLARVAEELPGPARQRRISIRRRSPVIVILCIILVMTGVAVAMSNLTNLGHLSNDVPAQLPVGGFKQMRSPFRQHGKPEVFFVELPGIGIASAEKWPLVKALNQFGILSHVTAIDRQCTSLPSTKTSPGASPSTFCSVPTFDLTRSRYSSRYLTFVYRSLTVQDGYLHISSVTPAERSLVTQYLRAGRTNGMDGQWYTTVPFESLPLLAIGEYAQRGVDLVTEGDLEDQNGVGLPFEKVRESVQRAKPASPSVPWNAAANINAEANVITALICHADHLEPRSVCGKRAIQAILRHVK